MTHRGHKRIVHVFNTHFAWQLLTSSWLSQSKQPKKRWESPQGRRVVFRITQNRDLSHFFLNTQPPNLLN